MELIHTWDQQILRLRHRVEELEEQNEQLRDLLKDAVRICDDAITTGHWIVAPSRFADTYRILLCHSVSLRSQVQLSWRWLLFSMTQLPLPYRRDSPKVGWPFEPVHDAWARTAAPRRALRSACAPAFATWTRSNSEEEHHGASRN